MPNHQTKTVFRIFAALYHSIPTRNCLILLILGLSATSTFALEFKNIDNCFSYNNRGQCESYLKASKADINLGKREIKAYKVYGQLDKNGTWQINADKAYYQQRSKKLNLSGNCKIKLTDAKGNKTLYQGQNFIYNGKTKILSSNDTINIFNNGQHLKAKGFVANIKTQKIRLLSKVMVVLPNQK